MDTKLVALVTVFAALTVVLSPWVSRIAVPSFVPGLAYNFFELPVVIALLLLGLKPGVAVGLIASLALLPLHPTYTGVWGILAWLSTILGVFVGYKLVNRGSLQGKKSSVGKTVLSITVGAIIFRTLIMAVQNYALFRYPYPIGYDLPEAAIVAMIPPIAIFNATQPLVIVPLGYFLAKAISSRLKIGNKV